MSQPPTYNRQFNFTNYQAVNPSTPLPGASVDLELNTIKQTLDATLANLKKIQRDDGAIANVSVGLDQLKAEVTVGFQVPVVWVTATAYATSNTVFQGSAFYRCLVAHTSGVFATDLAAAKWQLIVDLSTIATVSATQVAVTPSGSLTTNVQTSLVALDSGKAATSHTHPVANISDSTAAGRNMVTAANVAAQQALLGLGSLAFLNTIAVTQITANLAFINPISPGALVANTNDWAPTSLATSSRIRFSATSAINLTGILATTDGDIKILDNIGTFAVTLVSQSGSSAAANRFILSFPLVLNGSESCVIMYDGTTARWRLISRNRAEPTTPNIQVFTSGTGATYTTPTDANSTLPSYIRVRMVGAGAGGGAQSTNNGNNGTDTLFGSWTAKAGNGGIAASGAGGAGGTGGTNSTGTLLARIDGQNGYSGTATSTGVGIGNGGVSFFGGAGVGSTTTGGNAKANSGSGGAGGYSGNCAGGGGAGEYVEFIVTAPAASYTYTVGAKGPGGAAGTAAGGDGGAGRIEVEAYWQ